MIIIKLRELLWEKNISSVQLHNATGISKSKISEIIRGKRTNVTLETVEKICLYIGCKIEDLIQIKKELP
ncbi:helix-turn-helix transcriptional regulator [bacterium]|nr:helix-turn-helix transcriptional regulator [bacterium]